MYVFGFFSFWAPGLWFASVAALFVALFNHLYIWVHYYSTELPDMKRIYGEEPGKWQSNEEVFGRQGMKKQAYLNKGEMELAKSLENEEWISDLTKKEKKQYEEYARYSLSKRKRKNIRMSERDLKKIQAKVIEEGIPYQSLISMLIHKYNEGKLSFNR